MMAPLIVQTIGGTATGEPSRPADTTIYIRADQSAIRTVTVSTRGPLEAFPGFGPNRHERRKNDATARRELRRFRKGMKSLTRGFR